MPICIPFYVRNIRRKFNGIFKYIVNIILYFRIRKINPEELKFLKNAISTYKELRHIVHLGDWYPIKSPYSEDKFAATQYVSKDKKEALFFAFSTDFHGRTWMPNFKLQGLNPDKQYKVSEINKFVKKSFWGDDKSFTGDYLMSVGVNPNILLRGESVVLYLQEQ